MNKFQNKYRITSTRASWHDYNGGIYFVTICTEKCIHYFGEIENMEMTLSPIGRSADDCIRNIETLHPNIYVASHQVMPNHVHMIVIIIEDDADDENENDNAEATTTINKRMKRIADSCGHLSHIVSGFKYAVTKYARQNNIPFAWQKRFHDRIIRDQNEMNRIAEYIENNVAKWDLDKNNDKVEQFNKT